MIIPRRVLDDILQHAHEAHPHECCGLLVGVDRRVVESARTANLSADPARYEIDPRDHIAVRRSARARGLSVLGFYHSHAHSSPVPSETDRSEAMYDDAVYLIAGRVADDWSVRAFRIVKGEVEEVIVQVVDDSR